jgi:hypothetical protein
LTDSFKLNVVVRNFGRAINRQYRIEVVRKFNDDSTIAYDTIVNPVLYSDTLTLVLRNTRGGGFGNNTFTVNIDADGIIDEISETNNTVSLQYFIPLDGTKNLFPSDFAIVNTKAVDLSFQSTDLLSDEREFLLQIDTAYDFSSSYKKEYLVKGKVLARQAVTLLESDTIVYYWRTKLANPGENESAEWDLNSFTFIDNGPEGWAQVSFPQFNNNPSVGLVKDPEIKRLKFEENTLDIAIRNYSAAANKPRDSVSVKVNGVEYNLYHENNGATGCRLNTINLIAFDRKSTQPYAALYFKWYEIQLIYGGRRLICGREPYITNSFKSNEMVTGKNDDLIQYIDNVSEGDSVVLYNIGDADYANWPAAAKSKLGEIGISLAQLSNLQSGEAVVIFGKKGSAPGSAQFFRTSPTQPVPHKLVVNKTITGRYNSGNMNTSLIGPAQHWEDLIIQHKEAEAQDVYEFKITGIRLNGSQQVLRTGVTANEDLSFIDAEEFPYLRIEFQTTDDVLLTPVQLTKWLVTYEPFAEGIILYQGAREQQTVSEGDIWSAPYSFINISNRNFNGPLTVNYKAVNVSTFATASNTITINAPVPGDTTDFTIDINTTGQAGINDVEVFANPYQQPEQYFDNNVINLTNHLNVRGDLFSPVMDVTIDGRHLASNDFVSANPEIQIRVWDENRYLLKKDTTGLNIFLAYPCDTDDCNFESIHFSREDIQWFPATDTSDFIVRFNPADLAPGEYTLRVEAKDGSGNQSGREPYEISFIVSAETGISISKAYPNPFDYKTNFSIIIFGSDVPESFQMQIISLTGDVVHVFDNNDLPDFHVGTNTVRWSGTDSNGNSLPNGVYIYRMILKMAGKEYEGRGKVILAR